ncbi:LysR substrate-binding domain-containing protein [Dyella acidisoli]|nr:LysR substrate-binding domain-containing protein [Dyella acidisoli]
MHSSISLPPLEALAAMLAAARLGSFSAAAVDLGITHGSVSRRVYAVESWLGTPVFVRHGRGVRLTPAGEHFSRQVESALAKIADVAVDLRAARATPSRLRLSVLPSFARLWLMPRLAELQRACPGLMLQVLPEHRIANLDGSDADLAIRFGGGRWPGTEAQLLMKERLFAVAAPKLAKTLRDQPLAAILGEALLHDSDTQHWRSWCEQAGVAYRPRGGERRFDDYDLVLATAEAGLGVAIARWPLAKTALDSGRLVRVAGPEFTGKKAHYVVTRNGETRLAVHQLMSVLMAMAAT